MLVDSHAHLNFKAYKDDLSEVIGRCRKESMKVINVGAAYETSLKALEIAEKYKDMYVSLGLHPIHVYDEKFEEAKFQSLVNDKVVAFGETGFDFFHMEESLEKGAKSIDEIKNKQEEVFRQHIKLAKENNRPLIIHGRNGTSAGSAQNTSAGSAQNASKNSAYKEIYRVLRDEGVNKGVIHCYGGNMEEAAQFIDLGFHIGFTGIVTFKNAPDLQDIAKLIPLDKMLIETDSPYLAPMPYRGKQNEPSYVKYVAMKIAELRGLSVEEVIDLTGNNAIKLFNLK